LKIEKERQLVDGRGGKGMGEEPKHTTAKGSMILYKSFNTLWPSALFLFPDQGYRNKTEDVMTASTFSPFCILTNSPLLNTLTGIYKRCTQP
jgi:hypothetical protein